MGHLYARARGASMVEYALLLFAVLIVSAAAIKLLGPRVRLSGDLAAAELR
jgi:Flp pilus assembly pilin Flp